MYQKCTMEQNESEVKIHFQEGVIHMELFSFDLSLGRVN